MTSISTTTICGDLKTRMQKVALQDGTNLCIRKLHVSDRNLIKDFFSGLSSASKYNRYFRYKEELTDSELEYCIDSNAKDHYVIGAWKYHQSGVEKDLIGVASFVQLQDDKSTAEFAIIIADQWQHKGVGKYLTHAVLDCAKDTGINRILIYFLPSNTGMKKLAQSMTGDVSFKYDEGVIVADVHLEKDEVKTLFWSSDVSEIWENTFDSVIDMSFMPFTIYRNLSENNWDNMESLMQFKQISDFETWLDSIDDTWF